MVPIVSAGNAIQKVIRDHQPELESIAIEYFQAERALTLYPSILAATDETVLNMDRTFPGWGQMKHWWQAVNPSMGQFVAIVQGRWPLP